jgi:O-antigen/teichoic acid export membrane protein
MYCNTSKFDKTSVYFHKLERFYIMDYNWNSIKNLFAAFKDLTTLGFANVIGALIYGVFWFAMAALLGTEQYGKISYLITIATMTSSIASFGATNTVLVYTAKEQKIQTSVYFLVIVLSIIASLAVFFIVNDIGVGLLVFGTAVFSLVISEQLGRKLYKDYSKYVVSQRILLAGLAVGLYFLMGPRGIILGFALSYFPYLVTLYKGSRGSKIELSAIKQRLGFMSHSYAMDITGILGQSIDKLIIYPIFGFALLGNYQLGLQFLTVLTVIPGSVFQYILPRQASGLSDRKLVKLTVLFSIGIAILGVILAPYAIPYLFPKFKESVEIIQIMSLAIIPTTMNLIYASKFIALEKTRIVLLSSLLNLGIQVLVILILGRIYGINGAETAPVLAFTCCCIYYVIVSKKLKKTT